MFAVSVLKGCSLYFSKLVHIPKQSPPFLFFYHTIISRYYLQKWSTEENNNHFVRRLRRLSFQEELNYLLIPIDYKQEEMMSR